MMLSPQESMSTSAREILGSVAENLRIPQHEKYIFREKNYQFALVIPVINEGERIRSQLRSISLLNPHVDIIIADGGSTDGSLEPSFLQETGVRALLVKNGPGRLSAQLRMAYSFILSERYDGVITMDGNGKDGVDAINRFVERLHLGYDYIQGSRYAQGGRAINTPPDRAFGNRFIHAPLLSIAGRRRYTDTTNGFRAYSAEYLRDPRVLPFRDVFDSYELLFYLTVRAGQIGRRTCEVPVERHYPTDTTPTKISGYRGKIEILLQTVKAAIGHYSP